MILSVCLCLPTYLWPFLRMSVSLLSACLSMSFRLYINTTLPVSLCLSVSSFVCMRVYLPVHLSSHLSDLRTSAGMSLRLVSVRKPACLCQPDCLSSYLLSCLLIINLDVCLPSCLLLCLSACLFFYLPAILYACLIFCVAGLVRQRIRCEMLVAVMSLESDYNFLFD